uniref:Uncharacterized protein n=1 Tax=Plectus sambesii TaxID=2011161 RepID=A0A914XB11_9BILA
MWHLIFYVLLCCLIAVSFFELLSPGSQFITAVLVNDFVMLAILFKGLMFDIPDVISYFEKQRVRKFADFHVV